MKTLRLRDFKVAQERWAFRQRERRRLPEEFGKFIANLAAWDWFVNPLTVRNDPEKDGPPGPEVTLARRNDPGTGRPPLPDVILPRINEYLSLLQVAASRPVGWVIAEEFGRLGGRWHCHMLITGVCNLHRKFWWAEAFRRFGWTRIEPFDPTRGAAFYAAKYAAKALGNLHFGGALGDLGVSSLATRSEATEPFALSGSSSAPERISESHHETAPSVELPRDFFHLSMRRWHR